MCGIAGVVYDRPGPRPGLPDLLRAMSLAHQGRGPDGLDTWVDPTGRVGLGAVRLAVVGNRERGHQPISDGSGGRLVFNGQIYRPAQVMASLGGAFHPGESDGTVLLRLLQRRGVDGLRGVGAMFSLALFDPATGEVLLARDAWGQKPLYLCRIEGGHAFASTLVALHHAAGALRIRPEAMLECLIFKSVGGNHSAFQGVEQLPAGGWMRIGPGGIVHQGRWLDIPDPRDEAPQPERLRAVLDDAIASQCPPEHRPAIFLSGGLDSSIVATVASRQPTPAPRVLTIGYDVGGWEDEHRLAVRLAQGLGLEHRAIILRVDEVPDLLRESAVALEDPVHDPVTVPTLALSRAAAAETKVVLTGDGSDEFWGGYERFDQATDDLDAYLYRTMVFEPRDLGLDRIPSSYLDSVARPLAGAMPALDRILRLETANRLRNYHLSRLDKLSMSTGLEARSPFLEVFVTSLAMSLTAAAKRSGGRPKGMLIDAFAADLPGWLVQRRKQAFTVPVAAWLAGGLGECCWDTLASPNAFVRGLADVGRWQRAFGEDSGNTALAMRIWSLLHLEIWYQSFGRIMERKA